MTFETVRRRLAEHSDLLREFGVASIHVFGSVARGNATAQSDVDILVEFTQPVGLIRFVDLQQRLATILDRRVDLVTRAALKPQLSERILGEAIRAA